MSFFSRNTAMVEPQAALPGRDTPGFAVPDENIVLHTPQTAAAPAGFEEVWFGTGCFWGTEEICTGRTGHTEAVRIVYNPTKTTFTDLLKVFWETHDPTQGMRQGNDLGSQYRSAIYYTTDEQRAEAERTRDIYAPVIKPLGYGDITTEIAPLGSHFYAEGYHQQYLYKNPNGYRCHSKTGAPFPE